jgi:hypothetical protein
MSGNLRLLLQLKRSASTTQPCQLQRQLGHLLKQAQHQPPLPASTINPDLAESTNPEHQAKAMPPKIASE